MSIRKAVIFDWGGVLMRTVNYEPRHRWDRELRLTVGAVENVVHGSEAWSRAERGEISVDEYWLAVGRQLHLDSSRLYKLRHDFYSGDRLDDTLIDFIGSLQARKVKTGLLSNNSLELLETLADSRLSACFDGLVISAQIGICKPDPRAYKAILKKLGVLPYQALYVDDSQINVEGALAVGMTAIHFEPTIDLRAIINDWLRNPFAPTGNQAT